MTHLHQHASVPTVASRRRLRWAFLLLLLFLGGELGVGLAAHSLALVSDAAHLLVDAAALAVALLALRLASRPPGPGLTYGLRRLETLSAQLSGALMLLLSGALLYGSVTRLIHPPRVAGWAMVGAGLAGVLVNGGATAAVAGRRGDSLALEGSYRHLVFDLAAFLGTVVAGVAVLGAGFERADGIASLLIALLMARGGVALLWLSGRVLLEAAPRGLDPRTVGKALVSLKGVVEVHDLHLWQLELGFPILTAHVLIAAGEDPHRIRLALERLLRQRFGIEHSTLQVDHAARTTLIELELRPSGPPSSGAAAGGEGSQPAPGRP